MTKDLRSTSSRLSICIVSQSYQIAIYIDHEFSTIIFTDADELS